MMSPHKNPFLSLIDAVHPALEADEKHFTKWVRLHKEKTPLSLHARYDLADFVVKRGHFGKGWKRRWFILRGSYLYYYSDNTEGSKLRGVILMRGCSVAVLGEYEKHSHVIEVMPRTPRRPGMRLEDKASRKFFLSFESGEELDAWMDLIAFKAASVTHIERSSEDSVRDIVNTRRRNRVWGLGGYVSARERERERAREGREGPVGSLPRSGGPAKTGREEREEYDGFLPRRGRQAPNFLRSGSLPDLGNAGGHSHSSTSPLEDSVVVSSPPLAYSEGELRRRYVESVLGDTVFMEGGRAGVSIPTRNQFSLSS